MTIVRDPETGLINCGVYRQMVKSKNELSMRMAEATYGYDLYHKAWKEGKTLETVTFVGHHPACIFGGLSRKFGAGINELDVSGGIAGEPLEIVKCETIDLEVPAYSEIVIEGVMRPGNVVKEGPFGEHSFYYGTGSTVPIHEVTAITYRKDAIYLDLFNGHRDHPMSMLLPRQSILFKRLKQVVPQTIAVRYADDTRFVAYVQVRNDFDGLGKNTGLAALGIDPLIKIAVIVDEEVNINDESQIMWAIATRTRQADKDIHVIPDALIDDIPGGYSPASRGERGFLTSKIIIDATKPVLLPFPEIADPPKEIWEKINIADYLTK